MRMKATTIWAGGLAAMLVLSTAVLFAAGPTFKQRDFELRIGTLSTKVDIVYEGKRAKREYAVGMKDLYITHDKRVDAVCVSKELGVASATGDRRKNYLVNKTKIGDEYHAFVDGEAKAELGDAELTANPYLVETMEVEANVIIAEKRASVEIDPNVSSEKVNTIGGMTLRMQSREIKESGEAEIVIAYTRPDAAGAAFLERVELVSERGTVMGGGRWTEGDPFGTKGTWEAAFRIKRGEVLDRVRCHILQRYEFRTVTFEVTDVFQD